MPCSRNSARMAKCGGNSSGGSAAFTCVDFSRYGYQETVRSVSGAKTHIYCPLARVVAPFG